MSNQPSNRMPYRCDIPPPAVEWKARTCEPPISGSGSDSGSIAAVKNFFGIGTDKPAAKPKDLLPADFGDCAVLVVLKAPIGRLATFIDIRNPNDAKLEGTLKIPLPTGVTVASYAIRGSDGTWRTAVCVEKEKAAIAFDDAKQQKTGTASKSSVIAGNVNATDFAIEAKSTVTFRFDFEADAVFGDNDLKFILPAVWFPSAKYNRLLVVSESDVAPVPTDDAGKPLKPDGFESKPFVGSSADQKPSFTVRTAFPSAVLDFTDPAVSQAGRTAADLAGTDGCKFYRSWSILTASPTRFQFVIPGAGRQPFTAFATGETKAADGYFLASRYSDVKMAGTEKTDDKSSSSSSVAIVYDASRSRRNRNVAAEKTFLTALTKNLPATIKLIVFRNVADEPVTINREAIVDRLFGLTMVFDGATDINGGMEAVLSVHKSSALSRIYLFTDGDETLVHNDLMLNSKIPAGFPPMSIINSSFSNAGDRMKIFANKTGGTYIDVSGPPNDAKSADRFFNDAVLKSMRSGTDVYRCIGWSCEPPNAVRDVYLDDVWSSSIGARANVCGRITTAAADRKDASLTLQFGYQTCRPVQTVVIPLSADVAPPGGLSMSDDIVEPPAPTGRFSSVAHYWSLRRVRYLRPLLAYRKELVSLAVQYGLITDFTSLLILPDVQSHIKNRIPPADANERRLYDSSVAGSYTVAVQKQIDHLRILAMPATDDTAATFQTANGYRRWRQYCTTKKFPPVPLPPKTAAKPSTGTVTAEAVQQTADQMTANINQILRSGETVESPIEKSDDVSAESIASIRQMAAVGPATTIRRSVRPAAAAAAASAEIDEMSDFMPEMAAAAPSGGPSMSAAAPSSASGSGGTTSAKSAEPRSMSATTTVSAWKPTKDFYTLLERTCSLPPLPTALRFKHTMDAKTERVAGEQKVIAVFEKQYETIVKDKCHHYCMIGKFLMDQSLESTMPIEWIRMADRVVSNIAELFGDNHSAMRDLQLWYEGHAAKAGLLQDLFHTRYLQSARYAYRMQPNDTHARLELATAITDRAFYRLRTMPTDTAGTLEKSMAPDVVLAVRLLLESLIDPPVMRTDRPDAAMYPNLDALVLEQLLYIVTVAYNRFGLPTGITPVWLRTELAKIIERRALTMPVQADIKTVTALRVCAGLNYAPLFGPDDTTFQPIDLDILIRLRWTKEGTKNDQDLHVWHAGETNPDGVYYSKPLGVNNDLVSSDFVYGRGPEVFRSMYAAPATYEIKANFYSQMEASPSVSGDTSELVDIYLNYCRPNEQKITVWKQLESTAAANGGNREMQLITTITVGDPKPTAAAKTAVASNKPAASAPMSDDGKQSLTLTTSATASASATNVVEEMRLFKLQQMANSNESGASAAAAILRRRNGQADEFARLMSLESAAVATMPPNRPSAADAPMADD